MPNNEPLGAYFTIDTTNLKAGLAQANRAIRESESEFKAAAAGMDDWRESEEGLTAKIKSLNSITDIQQQKVNALQNEYNSLIAGGLDPASRAAVEMRTKINNETAALERNKAELEKQKDALQNFGKETEEAGSKLEGLKAAGGVAVKAIAAVGAACVAAVGSFFGLAESTREARNSMAMLETSFETAGLSAQAAEDTFTELYGILGDDGTATEAAQQLAKISKNEDDLAANTRILTGVMAEYGESIPTEGLAEGMAATAAMGEVQGVLADALEWQGVNLDEYNAKLATMATEEERAAYIQSTLTDLYGASADAYRENNAAIIESQKAQAELNQALNDLGAIAEPILTTLKKLATDLLVSITPFVSLIGEGLSGALSGASGAADTFASGLSGIVTELLERVVSMLPFVIETITAIVPQLLTALLSQLPVILTTLLNMTTQIISALSSMLPSIVSAIMAIIPQLVNSLVSAIPQILAAAVSLLMAIVQSVPVIVAELTAALPSVIQTVIAALTDAIPLLLESAVQLLMMIVEAIPTIIASLEKDFPLIINQILTSVIDAIPVLLQAATEFLMMIVEAIPTIVASLSQNMPKIISTILRALISRVPDILQAAVQLLMGVVRAIPQVVSSLVQNVPQLISAIVSGLESGVSSVAAVGGDLIRGLWSGISDMAGWIASKIQGFGSGVLNSLKNFFGIESPSKVMADVIGKNLALGIGEGFEQNIAGVNDKITSAMDFSDSSVKLGGVEGGGSVAGGVVVNQTNYYSQAHSRLELYKTKQNTAAAVRLAIAGA